LLQCSWCAPWGSCLVPHWALAAGCAFDLDQYRSQQGWQARLAKRGQAATPGQEIVSKLPLLRGIARRSLARLVRGATLRSLARDELLARRGGRLPGLCCLAAGSLNLCLGHGGNARVLGLVAEGESFAEAAALLGAPSPFDIVALSEASVVVLAAPDVEALLGRDARFAHNVVKLLARRALAGLLELEGAAQHAPQRLAAYLATLLEPAAEHGRWRARLPVSKTLVAARLGMKKETLSRLLRGLADEGLIAVAQRDITVLDRERLLAMAR
jgi:CRP-like cAMP-binding protein